MGLPGMCLQCASQGEKDEDHCKTTFSGGQNGLLTRVLKRTMQMAAFMGRLQLCFWNCCPQTRASTHTLQPGKHMAQSAQKRICPKHFVQAMEPLPRFQSLPFNMFRYFGQKRQFYGHKVCVHSNAVYRHLAATASLSSIDICSVVCDASSTMRTPPPNPNKRNELLCDCFLLLEDTKCRSRCRKSLRLRLAVSKSLAVAWCTTQVLPRGDRHALQVRALDA